MYTIEQHEATSSIFSDGGPIMSNLWSGAAERFRVWIGGCAKSWQPVGWDDVPESFVALEPAEEGSFSAQEAAAYLEGFNGRMIVEQSGRWAVAIPVSVLYQGDLAPGQTV